MSYTVKSGTLFEDFETIGDWSLQSHLSIAADITNFKTGSQSIQMTTDGGATSSKMTKTINSDFSQLGVVEIWIYFPEITNATGTNIILSSDSGLSARFTYSFGTPRHAGWNKVLIAKTDWVASGGADWANLMIRLSIQINCLSSTIANISFDSIYINTYSRPKCIIIFDDIYASVYSQAYSIMAAANMKGSIAAVSSYADLNGNRMTTANITEMHNAGWDVFNHTTTHVDLTGLANQAAMESEISTCKAWLIANGFIRNNEHLFFAYPFSAYNDTVLNALIAQGMIISRGNFEKTQGSIVDSQYLLCGRANANDVSLATVKAKVDLAIAEGGTVFLYFHNLTNSVVASTDWAISDFQSLINYIQPYKNGNILDVVTFTEWYRGLTSSRKLV